MNSSFHSFDYNCFDFSMFFFFLTNSHTFQIVLEDTCTSNHFSGISKNQNCCFQNNKVIIFISLESSCVTLQNVCRIFLFYCRVIWIFIKKCLKKN